jgi:tetratricopeptide (TPR) repeat protein
MRSTFLLRFLFAIAIVILVIPPAAAWAGKAEDELKAKARAEYTQATKNYNLAEYQQALDHFKEAYRAYSDSSFLFNIAQCHRMLDQKLEAIRAYRAYLRDARANRAEVEQIIASLEKAYADEQTLKSKKPTGTLGDPTSSTESPDQPVEPVAAKPAEATSVVVAASPSRPVYKKGWFWGVIVGAVVVVGVGVGVGVALGTTRTTFPTSDAANGTFRF